MTEVTQSKTILNFFQAINFPAVATKALLHAKANFWPEKEAEVPPTMKSVFKLWSLFYTFLFPQIYMDKGQPNKKLGAEDYLISWLVHPWHVWP